MARIDYDEDDHDDSGSPRRDWRRTLLTWLLAIAGLGLGFLVPYMLYLNHQVGERVGQLPWQVPTVPVIQNADAKAHAGIEFIRAALERQLYMPVLWTDTVQSLVRNGAAKIFECGPGKVLAGLCKRIDKSVEARSLGTPDDMRAALAEVKA